MVAIGTESGCSTGLSKKKKKIAFRTWRWENTKLFSEFLSMFLVSPSGAFVTHGDGLNFVRLNTTSTLGVTEGLKPCGWEAACLELL